MKKISHQIIIPEAYSGFRLDAALAGIFSDYSRARIQSWIKQGKILVDGKVLKSSEKIKSGQNIVIEADIEIQTQSEAEEIDLNIIFEDEALIVVNKPPGLVVHPGAGNQKHTLVNALLHHCHELSLLPRAGIIHRLDKNTSGLLIIAKNLISYTKLTELMSAREIKREYIAIVNGILISGKTINAPIGRHPKLRTRMAVIESGKPAITHYRIVEKFREHTEIKVQLETGRTHQIRVHMAHIKHPVVGDPAYGRLKIPKASSDELIKELKNFKRQALHAARLELEHPISGKLLIFEAPLPYDMQQLINSLKKDKRMHE